MGFTQRLGRHERRQTLASSLLAVIAVTAAAPSHSLRAVAGESVPRWEIKLLAIDANEGIDLADVDNNGRIDVVSGRNWYMAPSFTPRPLRSIEDWNGYVRSNGDFAHDVDKDGWIDVIAGDFISGEVCWYRNPQTEGLHRGRLWEKMLLVDTGRKSNEGQLLHDLDGDGVPEWIVNSWQRNKPQLLWRFAAEADTQDGGPSLFPFQVSDQGNGHGIGVGDINGDGLDDLVCGSGWYECPGESNRYREPWAFHPDWEFTDFSLPVLVRDVDGDGRNDIIWGTAHAFGLQWWRQGKPKANGKTVWSNQSIDESFSQAHALAWADLDGDGDDELVAGKRVLAHNGKDPGSEMPPCLHYYKWDPSAQQFDKHVINRGVVGCGLQIRTGDLDGDGRVDIAVAGKGGTFLLFNRP